MNKIPPNLFEPLDFWTPIFDAFSAVYEQDASFFEMILNSMDTQQKLTLFSILQAVRDSKQSNTLFKWCLNCILDKHMEDFVSLGGEMEEFLLTSIEDPLICEITPYILDNSIPLELPQHQIQKYGFYLMILRDTYPPLFRYYQPQFNSIVKKIGTNHLLSFVGIPSLSLFTISPTVEEIRNSEIITDDLYEVMEETTNPEIIRNFQMIIAEKYPFPTDFLNFPFPGIVSLCNQSIRDNLHFFDVVAREVLATIKTGQIEAIPNIARVFPIIVPYLMLAYNNIIYQDPIKYARLTNAALPQSPATVVQERMKHDLVLILNLSRLINRALTFDELRKHSIPFLVSSAIMQPKLLELNIPLFIYNDLERKCDFNFVYAYYAIKSILQLYKEPTKGAYQVGTCINTLKQCFDMISDEQTKDSLCVDIFSLIFLKKNDRFICTPAIAKSFITFIDQRNGNMYFKLGIAAIDQVTKANSLSDLCGANRTILYNALNKRNWKLADHMTHAIKSYRKIFVLSYSLYLFNEVNRSFLEGEKYSDMLNMEIGMTSLVENDCLSYVKDKFPQYSDLIEQRMNCDMKTLLKSLPQHDEVTRIIKQFDKNPKDFIINHVFLDNNSLINNQAPNTFDFLSVINMFGKFSSDFASLDIKTLLAKLVESGDYSTAINISRQMGFNMFEFIIKRINSFTLNSEFFELFMERYRTECQALAVTTYKHVDVPLPDHLRKFKTSTAIPPESSEDGLILATVAALENPNMPIDFFEDLMYRIDHQKFGQILVQKLDKIPEQTAQYMLDIVSYTLSEANEAEVQRILLRSTISKKISSNNPKDIINELIQTDKLKMLIYYIQSEKDINSLLILATKMLLHDFSKLRVLLSAFPAHFEIIAREFNEAIPLLIQMNPSETFKAFALLPKRLRAFCSCNDHQMLVDALLDTPSNLLLIKKQNLILFNEKDLTDILISSKQKSGLHDFLQHTKCLISLLGNNEQITAIYQDKILDYLNNISVSSYEEEQDTYKDLSAIQRFSNLFPLDNNILRFIKLASKFLIYMPFSYSNIPYTFSNSEDLIRLCFNFDMDPVAYRISEIRNVDLHQYILHRGYQSIQMCQFRQTHDIFNKYERKYNHTADIGSFNPYDPRYTNHGNETRDTIDSLSINSPFLQPYLKDSIFDGETIGLLVQTDINKLNAGNIIQFPIYSLIKFICKKKRKPGYIPYPKQNMDFFYKRYTSSESRLSFLASMSDFINVFSTLIALKRDDQIYKTFIHNVVYPSVCFNSLQQLQQTFQMLDPKLDLTGFLWNGFLEYCKDYKLLNCSRLVYLYKNEVEDAAIIAIDMFNGTGTGQVADIKIAYVDLKASLKYRANPDQSTETRKLSDNPTDYIKHLKNLTKVQLQICDYLMVNGIKIQPEFDAIHNTSASMNFCKIMIRNGDFNSEERTLFDEISAIYHFKFEDTIREIFKDMCNDKLEQIEEFIKAKKGIAEFNEIYLPILLQEITLSVNNWTKIPTIIYNGANNNHDRIKLFIEYDCLVEAYTLLTVEEEDQEIGAYAPLIAYRASLIGNQDLVDNCTNLIFERSK